MKEEQRGGERHEEEGGELHDPSRNNPSCVKLQRPRRNRGYMVQTLLYSSCFYLHIILILF